MIFYFYMNSYYFEVIIVGLVIIISIVINIASADTLLDLSSIGEESAGQNANITIKYLDRWR